MSTFARADAEITALFVKRSTGPADNQFDFQRLPYNLITYDDGTTGIEAVPQTGNDASVVDPADFRFDNLLLVDGHPFEWNKIET